MPDGIVTEIVQNTMYKAGHRQAHEAGHETQTGTGHEANRNIECETMHDV